MRVKELFEMGLELKDKGIEDILKEKMAENEVLAYVTLEASRYEQKDKLQECAFIVRGAEDDRYNNAFYGFVDGYKVPVDEAFRYIENAKVRHKTCDEDSDEYDLLKKVLMEGL